MKRPITNLVLGWLALFLSFSQINAQTTFAVDPQNVTGNPGDQFTVDITVSNFNNILSFQYSMTWNPAVIQFVSPVGIPGNLNGLAAANFGTNNTANGVLTVSWLDPDVSGVNLPNGSVIYSLTFNVLSANGTDIAFGSSPTSIEVTNGNGNIVTFNPVNGAVNGGGSTGGGGGGNGGGGGGGGGGNGGDLVINISSESAAAGSNICVDFSVENFDNILNFQYSMHFNPAVLSFTGVSGLNLTGLVASNFGTNNAANGTLTLSWLDPDVSGVTVPNGTVIYQVCFNVIGTSGQTSSVSINGTPTSIEVVDGASTPVGLTVNSGTVTVSGGNPPPPPPFVGFGILASDETVQNGDNFCIEFSVQDFDNILSMQYSMHYDPTQLQFTAVQGFNLAGLSQGLFNAATPGTITLSWLDPDVTGITIPDGTVIYEICFTAIGANNCNNSTQLTFNGTPTPIEVLNGNENPVTFNSNPGITTICDDPNGGGGGGGGNYTNLTFEASNETALPGEQLCVDVAVYNFDCIVSAQYTMHFNPAVLQYTGAQNLNLSGLVGSNFGSNNANNGVITLSWLDPDVSGVTLPDGTVIYSICFNVIGTLGQTSAFTFDGNPTSVEVTDCNPGNPTPDFVAGTQTVGSNCPGPVSITNALVTDVACFNGNTGSVDISVTGGSGSGSYTYVWTNGAGNPAGTTQDITGLVAGTYTVVVSSCNGAVTATATYTVTQPPSGMNITGTATPVTCFGETTGAVNITVSGGATTNSCNYSYLWSNGATTEDLSGLNAGTYVVTVTDCNNCQATSSFTVSGPPSELTITTDVTAILCNGDCNGQIIVNASGGVGPYQYMLNTGAFQNLDTYNNLCAGSYLVKVRDAFGCVKTANVFLQAPQAVATSATVMNATNGNNGSINLSVGGGTPPFTYLWSNGFTGQDPTGLAPGNYCVTITDANQCTASLCRDVLAPLVLTSMDVTPSCFGQCTGQLEVVNTGGSSPFTYLWSNGQTTNPTLANLCPGNYTVTVTSADGQTATMSGTVNGASSNVQITNAIIGVVSQPGAPDGTITLSVTGGFGMPYTYSWSNGTVINQSQLSNIGEGNYSVTVSDQYGCSATGGQYEVFYDPDPLVILAADDVIICASDSAQGGTLKVTVSGGIKPYIFTFTGGPGTTAIPTIDNNTTGSISIPNVHHGSYVVNIKDSAPGAFLQQAQVTVDMRLIDLSIDPVVIKPTTNGLNNGSINITVSGGDPFYMFQWNNGSTAEDQFNLPVGNYSLSVKDDNGCVEVFNTGLIVQPFLSNSSEDKPDCPGDANGSISVSPTGSDNHPYTYHWNTGSTDSVITNLTQGQYFVTITDAIGTTLVQTYTLGAESNIGGNAVQVGQILCNGDMTGSATISVSNGIPPYSYEWSNGQTTQTISNVAAGTYSVTVQGMVGCTVIDSVIIVQPSLIQVNVTTVNGGDCTDGNGSATANPIGGVLPFTYSWDDPLKQTSKTAILLAPNDVFTVTATDANGCSSTGEAFIDAIEPLVVEGIGIPDSGSGDGEAIAVVTSGTPPFTFTWRDNIDTDSILTELIAGQYWVKVSDARDCEQLIRIDVESETLCLEASVVITPEGDGFNEEFQIGCLSSYSDNKLEIYNRWGQMVFLANNYNNDNLWRGTNKRGGEVPDGVYYYVFEYKDSSTGGTSTKKGAVTVLRK